MKTIDKAKKLGAIDFEGRSKEVYNFKNGSYLAEIDRFVPLADGRIVYTEIEHYNGFIIKFNKNGIYGFAIFKGYKNLEDRIWKIADAKRICDELKSK